MRNLKTLLSALLLVVTAIAAGAFINVNPIAPNTGAGKGFAVIELFTSEGCSSCPPADDLVSRIQKEYKEQPVYILSFHVDYWDKLGWKDSFSSAAFSSRQRNYANYLKISSVYTPQIVVNGKTEFVGSEEGTLRNAIKTNLQKASSAQLALNIVKTDQGKVTIHYQTEGNENNTVLLLAVVEKWAQTSVRAGENKGRNLSHVQIVRNLQSFTIKNNKTGIESIALPATYNAQNIEIIGVLQNTTTGEITAATKALFPVAS